VGREVGVGDDLIDRLACGYVSKTSKEELQKQGFRMVGAEERGNRASCAFITELVACAFDRQIDGIDIVTNDDTILAAVVKAQEQGKDIRVLGSDAHSEAFIRRCNRFCYIDILQGYEPERCLTPLSEIISDVYRIIIEERASGICTELSGLIHKLTKLHTEFDTRNYGYTSMEELILKNGKDIQFYKDGERYYLEMIDDRENVEHFITAYLSERNNKIDDMQELFDALSEEFERFDTRNYGYASDIAFLLSFPKLEIYNNKGVKLKQSFKLK